jgi:hypothetical protein
MSQRLVVIYRLLLWCYPKSFRATFAHEMEAVFHTMLADQAPAGPWALAVLTGREFGGVVIGGLTMRIEHMRMALWGKRMPPETFSIAAMLRTIINTFGALLGGGLIITLLVNVLLDVTVPQTTHGPIGKAYINDPHGHWPNAILIPAGDFACSIAYTASGNPYEICRTRLEGGNLQITLLPRISPNRVPDCLAHYRDRFVACQTGFGYGYRGSIIMAHIPDALGISPARAAQLRAEQPILYATEATWLAIFQGVAWGLAFLAAAVFWRRCAFQAMPLLLRGGIHQVAARTGQLVISLSGGYVIFNWMSWWLLVMLLYLGLVD